MRVSNLHSFYLWVDYPFNITNINISLISGTFDVQFDLLNNFATFFNRKTSKQPFFAVYGYMSQQVC